MVMGRVEVQNDLEPIQILENKMVDIVIMIYLCLQYRKYILWSYCVFDVSAGQLLFTFRLLWFWSDRSAENSQVSLQLEDTSTNGTGVASAAGEWLPLRKGETHTLAFTRNQVILPFCNKGTVEAVSQRHIFWQAFVTIRLCQLISDLVARAKKGNSSVIPISSYFCVIWILLFSQIALAIGVSYSRGEYSQNFWILGVCGGVSFDVICVF